jgi:hypothetical protein
MDIKLLLDRQIVKNKRGSLSEKEIQTLVKDWHNRRSEGDLQQETIEMETKAIEKKLRRYNVEQLGEMPLDQEDRTMRILVCQMGGCASKEARELKKVATEKLIRKYDINMCLFMELNFNWTKVSSSANFASWFNKEEREMRCFTAYNTQEFNETFGRHQPRGTGMVCRHKFLQYARKLSADFRGLGRWCSLAILLQSYSRQKNSGRILPMFGQSKRTKNSIPVATLIHTSKRTTNRSGGTL